MKASALQSAIVNSVAQQVGCLLDAWSKWHQSLACGNFSVFIEIRFSAPPVIAIFAGMSHQPQPTARGVHGASHPAFDAQPVGLHHPAQPVNSIRNGILLAVITLLLATTAFSADSPTAKVTVEQLTQKLWPKERLEQALCEVDQQKAQGLLSNAAYAKRHQMLEQRLAGTYQPESLSVADPPLNFIQNGGFEQINPNSAKNRSRWLWWNGWSWGGDYENRWEEQPAFVHSGKRSARIRCTGAKGRIGINTPPLPSVPGVTEYQLTFWSRGAGDNLLFVNFEAGATGTIREQMGNQWKEYTVVGKPVAGKKTYNVFFYAIGEGTIWLDDVALVPIGGKLDE